MRVVIIGAGLAGLSAACHLRARRHDVTVVEAGEHPGGRAGTLTIDGYRFDTGPSVLTFPHLVDECIEALGLDPRDHITFRRLDPMYRACFADGSTISVRADRSDMTDEIARVCGRREADAFDALADWLGRLYAAEWEPFIARNYDSPLSLLRRPDALVRLARLGGFRRLEAAVRRRFSDDRLVRLFSFQALYAGLAPHRALALYAVITYMDSIAGVYAADGGVHAVPTALAGAATSRGVDIRYRTAATEIVLAHGDSGRVRGVRTDDGAELRCDAVVCTPDLPVAYRTLLTDLPAPRRLTGAQYAPSAIVWHAGVRGDLSNGAAHHNIHFGAAWTSAFEALVDRGEPMPDPSILVTVPTVSDPTMAPPGRHVLFALEPAPNLDGRVDWAAARTTARARLGERLAELGYPSAVEAERFVDPTDWEAAGMERGTPFALSHRFLQSGPFRPANVRRRAPGLVFAGSGTVPGVGVPMVLVSGRLAADRVEELAA